MCSTVQIRWTTKRWGKSTKDWRKLERGAASMSSIEFQLQFCQCAPLNTRPFSMPFAPERYRHNFNSRYRRAVPFAGPILVRRCRNQSEALSHGFYYYESWISRQSRASRITQSALQTGFHGMCLPLVRDRSCWLSGVARFSANL